MNKISIPVKSKYNLEDLIALANSNKGRSLRECIVPLHEIQHYYVSSFDSRALGVYDSINLSRSRYYRKAQSQNTEPICGRMGISRARLLIRQTINSQGYSNIDGAT